MIDELELPADACNVNLYGVLGLPLPSSARQISSADIKAAHRRAVLTHHPDKSGPVTQTTDGKISPSQHSIDTIQLARSILLSPTLRAEYDRTFLTARHGLATQDASVLDPSTVLETIDLDDMSYSEETRSWTWPCRCGNSPAYAVPEEALWDLTVDHNGRGEVIVACEGCSLYKRVVFEDTEQG